MECLSMMHRSLVILVICSSAYRHTMLINTNNEGLFYKILIKWVTVFFLSVSYSISILFSRLILTDF